MTATSPALSTGDGQATGAITPLGHRTVEEALVEQLRDAIVTGSLTPGDRLVYRDLARRFGVSVTPVRIALRELSKEGLVEMRAHAGARVSLLSLDELEEIFVIRIGIEGWLSQLGAERLTDEGIARMAVLLEDLKQAEQADDREAYLQRSWAFRTCCYEAAGKPRLLERTSALYDLSTRYHFLTIAEVSTLRALPLDHGAVLRSLSAARWGVRQASHGGRAQMDALVSHQGRRRRRHSGRSGSGPDARIDSVVARVMSCPTLA